MFKFGNGQNRRGGDDVAITPMIKLELSAKSLLFTIAALEFQIQANATRLSAQNLSEDETSDLSNDTMLLRSTLSSFMRAADLWRKSPTPEISPSRTKLNLILQCLLSGNFTEKEQDMLIAMGTATSPDPAWTDYIYWPNRHGLDGSIDAALDKIFSYRPIAL
jgi:hypothetical protein